MRGRCGFTMVEIVVVIAVIAILVGFLTPTLIKQIQKSKFSRLNNEMDSIATAFNDYFVDTGEWPDYDGVGSRTADFVDFRCIYINDDRLNGWDGPYLQQGINVSGIQWVAQSGAPNIGIIDPWGQLLRVSFAAARTANGGPRGAIVVICGGPDKVIQTSVQNAFRLNPTGDDLVRMITRVVQ